MKIRLKEIRRIINEELNLLAEARRSNKVKTPYGDFVIDKKDNEWIVLSDLEGNPIARETKRPHGRVYAQGTNPDFEGRDAYALEYFDRKTETWKSYND